MEFRRHTSISDFDPAAYATLVPAIDTPLLSRSWLAHLENSGSITPSSGWHPDHLGVYENGRLIAVAPAYIRTDSWGEFVFDFAWAEVADQLQTPYYPKLVGMSPATPSSAYSFLTAPDKPAGALYAAILQEFQRYCRSEGIPVLQFNFVAPSVVPFFSAAGLPVWRHHGFEWRNEGYGSFDDYLGRFRKNQRRNIRRERASAAGQGLALSVVPGELAPDHFWPAMAQLYQQTNDQFGPYAARFLTSEFFTAMPADLRRKILFCVAAGSDPAVGSGPAAGSGFGPLALAMLLRGGDRIIGRYWGAYAYYKDLHFNLCYYTPIEWAIRNGISIFDPGMGSTHKVRRGFSSTPAFSHHYFVDRRMQSIFAANIDHINEHEDARITELNRAIPWSASPATD